MKASLAKSIARTKEAGFSHYKAELEAQLNRDSHRKRWDCTDCTGGRRQACSGCTGTGYIRNPSRTSDPLLVNIECGQCNGEGGESCHSCRGTGNRGCFDDTSTCQLWLMEYLADKEYGKTLKQLEADGLTLGSRQSGGGQDGGTVFPWLTYAKFYYDGSVDSELTFTVPVEQGEKLLLVVNAFKALAEVAGNGRIDVRGSGMHLAVLPEGCNGIYPNNSARLNGAGLTNFINEVTKLLPALYFVGTAGHRSRSMQYRYPRISNTDKYSAVYTRSGTVFEFRVFETCYDRPEAIFDFLQVISNALRFYADPTLKVKALGKKFGFPSATEIAHYYSTTEQLRILNATVKYLKPEDKSYRKLKDERGLKDTIKTLSFKERARIKHIRIEYHEYKKHHDTVSSRKLTDYELSQVDWHMLEDGLTHEKAVQQVLANRQPRLVPFSEFLSRNITKQRFNQTITV